MVRLWIAGSLLIDVEEGVAGFVFPIGSNGESPNMRFSGSLRSKAPHQMNREEMKARRKWNSECEWY